MVSVLSVLSGLSEKKGHGHTFIKIEMNQKGQHCKVQTPQERRTDHNQTSYMSCNFATVVSSNKIV